MKKNLIVNGLEIFYRDLPPKTLHRSRALCSALKGGDWRLPTHKEIMYLYDLHKLGILGFKDDLYWSYDEDEVSRPYAFSVNFKDGEARMNLDQQYYSQYNIRPVRRHQG